MKRPFGWPVPPRVSSLDCVIIVFFFFLHTYLRNGRQEFPFFIPTWRLGVAHTSTELIDGRCETSQRFCHFVHGARHRRGVSEMRSFNVYGGDKKIRKKEWKSICFRRRTEPEFKVLRFPVFPVVAKNFYPPRIRLFDEKLMDLKKKKCKKYYLWTRDKRYSNPPTAISGKVLFLFLFCFWININYFQFWA